ncbi:TlpA family protein disulfide reductase [Pedobacter polysacchareus]|uniref:TlpA family protein disulfide reductase n=1 Tax=Pedobacter polysacchareus TaxID=2861973 RepID=UPI001C99F873|nr:TlpA disulfide reductase family protein [Pedobacter polysacchareus]
MKNLILTILFQVICLYAKSQTIDLPTLFKKVDDATQQIKSGHLKLNDNYTKVSVGEDSSKRFESYDYYFKSNPLDTIIGYKISSLGSSGVQQLYNGSELLVLIPWDRKLEIAPLVNNPQKIKQLKQGTLFVPLIKSINYEFQRTTKQQKLEKWTLFPNKVSYKGQSCYKISAPPYIGQNNRSFANYYVSVNSFIPVGLEHIIENTIASAKEIQTFEIWISDFKPNTTINDKQFNKESLSGYDREITIDETVELKSDELLKKGSISPDWELPLLTGGTLKLNDLKNKIVILDFWYKACAPCQKQMIDLQKLHDKFDKSKVVFVSVNTKDDPIKDKLALFMKNRALTMTTVYEGNLIEKLYHVYTSPALFIINQSGEIAFTLDGYSNTLIEDLNNEIERLL